MSSASFLLKTLSASVLIGQIGLAQTFPQRKEPSASLNSSEKRLFERLVPNLAGSESTLVLSEAPMSGMPLRLFRDGIELEPAKEFELSGQTIHLLGSNARMASSVYQAAYYAAVQGVRSTAPEASRSGRASENRVLGALLDRAMEHELSAFDALEQRPGHAQNTFPANADLVSRQEIPISRARAQTQPIAQDDKEPQSMRLLRQVLSERSSFPERIAGRPLRNSKRSFEYAGVEGIGDNDVPTPFNGLSDRPLSNKTSRQFEDSASRRTKHSDLKDHRRTPASERMLRNLFEGN